MTQQIKQYSVIRCVENIIAIGLMFGGLLFVTSGDTYVSALYAIGAGIALSILLLLIRPYTDQGQRKLTTYAKAAFICWGFVIFTFIVPIFGIGLDGLGNWVWFSLFTGTAGMISASIALFITSRPQSN